MYLVIIIITITTTSITVLLNCLYPNLQVLLFFSPSFFSCPTGRRSKLEAGWCLGTCLVKPQQSVQNTKCVNWNRRSMRTHWDQWSISSLFNKNPSKFALSSDIWPHFLCFMASSASTQARLVHLFIYSVAYLNLCVFAAQWWSEALFDGEGSVAFKKSGCRKLENCLLSYWENACNGHVV